MNRDDLARFTESELLLCARCGCRPDQACKIEVLVTRPNGQRAVLVTEQCSWSAPRLCAACDERLLPELQSLLGVWRQLGGIAMLYREA